MKQTLTKITMILFTPLLFIACGQFNKEPAQKIAATVNEEPIYAFELDKIVARKMKQDASYAATAQDRQEELDLIIDKKLIIQEAVDNGLAREEKFVDSIKAHWEQALVRDFIERKSEEFASSISVNDAEIQEYYRNLDKRVTFNLIKNKDRSIIEQALKKALNKEEVALPWEKIGPVRFGELSSDVLRQAFTLEVGGAQAYEAGGEYYLVVVAQKELIDVKPLESIRGEVEAEIRSAKEKQLFEAWLASKRMNAKINILTQ